MQSTDLQNTNQPKFAFLIHFRNNIAHDLRFAWKPLSLIPEQFYQKLLKRVQFSSMRWGKFNDELKGDVIGRNEFIPLSPEMFFSMGQKEVIARIDGVLDKLVAKGYQMVGLGALTSAMTMGGAGLRHRKDIGITNGNAFTAVMLARAVQKLIDKNPKLADNHAIVGASGSVGSCMARILVKKKLCSRLYLIARNEVKLQKLATELSEINPEVRIFISTSVTDICNAQLSTLLTASTENIIQPDYLHPDAVILDGTQPRNSSESLLTERPDVTIVDGGIVHVSGMKLSKKEGIGLPVNHYFACLCETALLTLSGHKEHFSIGQPTLSQAEYIEQLAVDFADYGFDLAPFLSFGKPLNNSIYG